MGNDSFLSNLIVTFLLFILLVGCNNEKISERDSLEDGKIFRDEIVNNLDIVYLFVKV